MDTASMLCRIFRSTRLAVKGTDSFSNSRLCLRHPQKRKRDMACRIFLSVKARRQKIEEEISPATRPITAMATLKRIPCFTPYR